ncbi:MAG: hypothetical protein AAF196_05300 [Planctomycetota bacterium]
MSEQTDQKRPGGLTAIAVINFIWSAGSALYTVSLALLILALGQVSEEIEQGFEDEQQREMLEFFRDNMGLLYGLTAIAAATTILLIASGVGYLQQKKFLGRTLGIGYAVLSIAGTLLPAAMTPADAGGGFNLESIVFLVYPALTLILLNSTFKHDFIR